MKLYKVSWINESSKSWEAVHSIEDKLKCCFDDNGGKVHSRGGIKKGNPSKKRTISGRVPEPLVRHFKEDIKDVLSSFSTTSLKEINFVKNI